VEKHNNNEINEIISIVKYFNRLQTKHVTLESLD